MAPEQASTRTDEQKLALYREIERRLSALPGVQSVGITTDLPVQCNCNTDWIRIVGKPFHGEHNEVDERDVSPDYLADAEGTGWCADGCLSEDDDASKPQVMRDQRGVGAKVFSRRRSHRQDDRRRRSCAEVDCARLSA